MKRLVLNGEVVEDNRPEENETEEQHDEDDLFLIGNTLKNPNNKRESAQVEEDNNEEEVEQVQTETLPKQTQANKTYGLQLTLPSGEYDGIDVKQKLEGLKVLVNEDREYTVEIVLKEKK